MRLFKKPRDDTHSIGKIKVQFLILSFKQALSGLRRLKPSKSPFFSYASLIFSVYMRLSYKYVYIRTALPASEGFEILAASVGTMFERLYGSTWSAYVIPGTHATFHPLFCTKKIAVSLWWHRGCRFGWHYGACTTYFLLHAIYLVHTWRLAHRHVEPARGPTTRSIRREQQGLLPSPYSPRVLQLKIWNSDSIPLANAPLKMLNDIQRDI